MRRLRVPLLLLVLVFPLLAIRSVSARGILALRPGLPDRVRAIAAADFTADGKPDLMVTNFEAGDVSLYQGTAGGEYVERNPSPLVVLSGPTFIATGDFNADDRVDAVIVNRLARSVSIRLSDPDLTIRATPNLLLGRAPQSVAVADFNSDTRLDLAVVSQDEDLVYLFNGKGDGNFGFVRTIDVRSATEKTNKTETKPYGSVAADFNGDGRPDLAVTKRSTDELAILPGNGDGTFRTPTARPVGRHPTYLVTARLNDDGAPGATDDRVDLLVLLEGGKQNPQDEQEVPLPGGVAVLPGNGDGTFTDGAPLLRPLGDDPVNLAAGRLDLGTPGFDDLVVANFAANTLSLYPADGAGGFSAPLSLGGGSSTLSGPVGVALMNLDGSLDGSVERIAVANFNGYSFTLFDGGGGQPFTENALSPVTATRQPLALLARSLDSAAGDDLVMLAAEDPGVKSMTSLNDGYFFKHRPTPLPPGSGPTAMDLVDLDRDARPDAVVSLTDVDGDAGAGTAAGLALLKGSGNSTFGSSLGRCSSGTDAGKSCASDAGCPGGTCAYSVTFGACDDGDNFGLSCAGDTDCPGGACIFPDPPTPLLAPATQIVAVDLNPLDADADGVPNAIDNCPSTPNTNQANTRGLLCVGGANSGDPCTGPADCPGGSCTGLDIRGDACDSTADGDDGDLVAQSGDNCTEVYNPDQIDLDANRVGSACDHDPDLVVLEATGSRIETFLSPMGGGVFPPATALPTGTGAAAVAVGNFTGADLDPDLVLIDRTAATFQVFAGDGKGGFAPQPAQGVGTEPSAVTVIEANAKDLDLDGVLNASDNCPVRYNPGQADADADGQGDACSQLEDPDGDAKITLLVRRQDNCPDTYNPTQVDTDGDRLGDACDQNPATYNPADDEDGDLAANPTDNCPTRYNPAQTDSNADGVGNDCDEPGDADQDRVVTTIRTRDNCPDTYNPDQADSDGNNVGDACQNVNDLAVVDGATGGIVLLLQSPPGSWVTLPPIPTGAQPSSVVAVDLNSDGVSDLVVANAGDSTLTVLLGLGDGRFLADPSFATVPVFPAPRQLAAGFLVRDLIQSRPEVAFLSPSLHNPVILTNILSERADTNDSGRVDGKDLAQWARGFGLTRANPGYSTLATADINLDGVIDGLDLVYIATQFGSSFPAP